MEYICYECEDPCKLTIAMKADVNPDLCPWDAWDEDSPKWKEKEGGEWIDYNIQQPKTDGEYIVVEKVYDRDNNLKIKSVRHAYYDIDDKEWKTGQYLGDFPGARPEITHWMELPNPPGEIDNKRKKYEDIDIPIQV